MPPRKTPPAQAPQAAEDRIDASKIDTGQAIALAPDGAEDGVEMAQAANTVNVKLGEFVRRHLGPSEADVDEMLRILGYPSLDALMRAVIPDDILNEAPLSLPSALGEAEALAEIGDIASQNEVRRSFIGIGYSETRVPAVIQQNIMGNPGWYTSYTPYQAEISQGRLEALLNFQTMIVDLTGLEVANGSLLDEATAAAEAMTMAHRIGKGKKNTILVANDCNPQTIGVIQTRAKPLGIEVVVDDPNNFQPSDQTCGIILQYPNTNGAVHDYKGICDKAHEKGAIAIVATDPLALTMLRPPGEFGADIAFGNTQRFGVPMGFGGPHAAFFSTKKEYMRQMPGRLVGVSKDANGNRALRLTLVTREQHIRREKATSNICTAQALLATMASMYGVYHGPDGLKDIASRIHKLTQTLADGLSQLDYEIPATTFFDTIKIQVTPEQKEAIIVKANEQKINLRVFEDSLGISIGETTTLKDIQDLFSIFATDGDPTPDLNFLFDSAAEGLNDDFARKSKFMTASVFQDHHSEMALMRYMTSLEDRDVALNRSMIPLGSCTMKLTAAISMLAAALPEFINMHPFAPKEQTVGYQKMIHDLETWLAEITGLHAVSLQPNAGSQGEYAGLQIISKYHEDRCEKNRKICLMPEYSHGTNAASAAMAGMEIVVIKCTKSGDVDLDDLRTKVQGNSANLAAIMITYPSTYGTFDPNIKEICNIVHQAGGLVYMDGANMNAQVGWCRPGEIGADVMHLNLHKTFTIPHGGGGPGIGPVAVAKYLAHLLPTHPLIETGGGETAIGPVSAAPWGSASILPIVWMYIRMMGAEGLKLATATAVLNANYVSKKLSEEFPTLFQGRNGLVAHECILDPRQFKDETGVTAVDIAKRLMDHGFHAPTMSFPVPGTLMVEPTESESRAALDALVTAVQAIHREITDILQGRFTKGDNPLTNAPHTAASLLQDTWDHPYSRSQAAYPGGTHVQDKRYWPPVGRIDDAYGDRNPVLTIKD